MTDNDLADAIQVIATAAVQTHPETACILHCLAGMVRAQDRPRLRRALNRIAAKAAPRGIAAVNMRNGANR